MGFRPVRTVVALGMALLLVTTAAGCAGGDTAPDDGPIFVLPSGPSPEPLMTSSAASARPTPSTSASRRPSPSPSASAKQDAPVAPKPATKAPKPAAVPAKPKETSLPPPVPAPAPSGGCTPRYSGTKVGTAQVKQALEAAAARTYWPTSAPEISIPANLVKATAWQESGWQSNIIACDGGVGLMQVMPGTAQWMNQRFGESYDIGDHRDNAYLGATYLAWLTKYIGDMYFAGSYSLDPGNCSAALNSCLLNAVIAAYNYGHAAVATDDGLVIPNPRYVNNVRALMNECVCLGY